VVAQRFNFFHSVSRSLRHLFYVAVPLRDQVWWGAPEGEKQQHAPVKERKRGCDGGTFVGSVVILNAAEGDETLSIHRYGLARPACTSPVTSRRLSSELSEARRTLTRSMEDTQGNTLRCFDGVAYTDIQVRQSTKVFVYRLTLIDGEGYDIRVLTQFLLYAAA
jgi:hypothetical protein